jgi:hypothetical protein
VENGPPKQIEYHQDRDTSLCTAYVVSNALDFLARISKQGINNARSLHAIYISSNNTLRYCNLVFKF